MLVSAAWIGPAILGAIDSLAQHYLGGESHTNIAAVLFASLDWLLYAALTPGVFWAARRWPLARPHLVRHAILHLGIALLFCVAWAGAGTLLKALLVPSALWGGPLNHLVRWTFITLPFGVAVYLGVVGVEHAIRYFVEARELSERLTQARLAALQSAVNPHFLFNTLNTIGVLVQDGERAEATRIIEQFGEVMRRMLSRNRAHEVMLADELDLVHHYLAIEQMRFADRLTATFEIDDDVLAAAIPSFALQHLVENAIRHAIAKDADARAILVRARRDGDDVEITVIDDGPGFPAGPAPAGHGLENTRERLRALYGARASLIAGNHSPRGTIARMRVPYRELVLEAEIA